MKKILCFGDSNTFGFIPTNGSRYKKTERWSGILGELLAPEYEVIEEGMNNRTGFVKNPEGLKFSGGDYLPIFLQNHKDIDICILSLGTNDTQFFYNLEEIVVIQGLQNLIDSILDANENTKIIIVPPVKIKNCILKSGFGMMFNQDSIANINKYFHIYNKIARLNNCQYFDFNEIASPSNFDGLHYEAASHQIIAQKLAEFIKSNPELSI